MKPLTASRALSLRRNPTYVQINAPDRENNKSARWKPKEREAAARTIAATPIHFRRTRCLKHMPHACASTKTQCHLLDLLVSLRQCEMPSLGGTPMSTRTPYGHYERHGVPGTLQRDFHTYEGSVSSMCQPSERSVSRPSNVDFMAVM